MSTTSAADGGRVSFFHGRDLEDEEAEARREEEGDRLRYEQFLAGQHQAWED